MSESLSPLAVHTAATAQCHWAVRAAAAGAVTPSPTRSWLTFAGKLGPLSAEAAAGAKMKLGPAGPGPLGGSLAAQGEHARRAMLAEPGPLPTPTARSLPSQPEVGSSCQSRPNLNLKLARRRASVPDDRRSRAWDPGRRVASRHCRHLAAGDSELGT
jgi:hypothetical protein